MSRENAGPAHDDACLAATAHDALCRCARHDWLEELVPRAQARYELLSQLAAWGTEQRVLAETEIRNQTAPLDGRPGWAQQGVRAAASMASEVYVGVRRTALNMRSECDFAKPDTPAHVDDTTPPAEEAEPESERDDEPEPPEPSPSPYPVGEVVDGALTVAVQGSLL